MEFALALQRFSACPSIDAHGRRNPCQSFAGPLAQGVFDSHAIRETRMARSAQDDSFVIGTYRSKYALGNAGFLQAGRRNSHALGRFGRALSISFGK